jgi:Bifunctional DNA primase/polymerase, N-terminal
MATTESGDRSISLVRSLQTIPIDWALTPVNGNKIPYTTGWQKTPVPRDSITIDINSGQAQGFGILTGKLSGGIMAIDCDGHIPHQLFKDILESDIPHTVSFTSGKDGRAQYLFTIPEEHWDVIKTKKIGNARKEGQLEFRWDGCQSVLPPSVHPETGQYQWVNSPDTTEIAPLPDKVLDYLLKNPKQKISPLPNRTKAKPTKSSNEVLPPIPIERCLSIEQGNKQD